MVTIENEILRITIAPKGAELQSIFHKQNQTEYMWNGNPDYWGKHSPVLFPIVGSLKDNTYLYNGQSYQLSRHGFARDMTFDITEQTSDSVVLSLHSNAETLEKFPFHFVFSLRYTLVDDTLSVSYIVKNTSNTIMYFSVGGHPAFKVPLTDDTTYTDYRLTFNRREMTGRWPLSPDGLILQDPLPLLDDDNILPLEKELFYTDAVVLKHLDATSVRLESDLTERGMEFDFTGFPFLGIWAAKNADFVCIEPWCGIADCIDTDQQLINKEGIEHLETGGVFERQWSVKLF